MPPKLVLFVMWSFVASVVPTQYADSVPHYSIVRDAPPADDSGNAHRLEHDLDEALVLSERQADQLRHEHEREEAHSSEIIKRWFDGITIFVLAGTAAVFIAQYRAMNKTFIATQLTLTTAQSEIIFKDALRALDESINLLLDTLPEKGPSRASMTNWTEAVILMKTARRFREEFKIEEHRVAFDRMYLPRYKRELRRILDVPYSREEEFYRSGDWAMFGGRAMGVDQNFIPESDLVDLYRFARGTESYVLAPYFTPEEISERNWLMIGGLIDYIQKIREMWGR